MEMGSDQLNIDTPELVDIEMPLAGIGSRFIALLVDYLIWGAAFLVLGVLAAFILPGIKAFSKISAQSLFSSFFSSTGVTSRCSRRSGTGARRASGWRGFA